MKFSLNWDALGITTSVACAIHCAVLPLVLGSLPVFGIDIIENALFEFTMIALAFVVGVISLFHGFKKHHHRFLPILLFTAGILLLVAKQIWHEWHIWLLIPAVIAMIAAHFFNFRFCRLHNHAHKEDCNH